jgi:hypothetical protein
MVTTLVGKGLFEFGDLDGPIATARLQHPLGIAWLDNVLVVCDSYNHKIKTIDLRHGTVATIAGGAGAGFLDGRDGKFAEPGGLAIAPDTRLIYVADTNNHSVRVIDTAGTIRTLKLTNGAEAQESSGVLPNLHEFHLTQKVLCNAGSPLEIQLILSMPKNVHLNAEAPLLADASSSLFERCELLSQQELNQKVLVSLKTSAVKIGASTIKARLQVYYCGEGDNSACKVASFVWSCAAEVSDQSAAELLASKPLRLEASLPA